MDYYNERDDLDAVERETVKVDDSPILQWYSGTTILLTGGCGFVGRVLAEKILRCCPGVRKVYLLLRSKKGKCPNQRVKELFEDEMFDKIREKEPNFMDRVATVNGDLTEDNCGLTPEDINLLENEIHIVFHAGAALRMNETLRVAYNTNVRATKDLLRIAERMKNLKAFIHVSTAYSQTQLAYGKTEEVFYDTPYEDSSIDHLLKTTDDTTVAVLTQKLLGSEEQNTYAFTKAMAEDVVRSYWGRLPVGVVRPAIVTGCWEEPLAGWINNVFGATGVVVAASLGLMRAWHGHPKAISELVPVDIVVNAIMAAAWDIHREFKLHKESKERPPIYNVVSSNKSPITWEEFTTGCCMGCIVDKMVMSSTVGVYNFRLQPSRLLYYLQIYYWHVLPAIIIDSFTKAMGKVPRLVSGYSKIHAFNMKLSGYSDHDWEFSDENMDRLWSEMSDPDRKLFNFDMTDFNWELYLVYLLRGIRLYILKDPMETLPHARNKYLWWLRYEDAKTYLFLLLGWALYSCF